MSAQNICFPEEILIEIFCYVEAKYLLGCKSVCKLWCAVIRSKHLVEMHLMRNGHRYYDMHIVDERLRSDGKSCRGLVLSSFYAASSSVTTYRISNPTTNYSMDLPHPHKGERRSMHLFLNTCTDSYNVLSICIDAEKRAPLLELLDLGGQSNDPSPNKDLSWTTLNLVDFENVSLCHPKYCMSTEGIILYILHSPYFGSTKPKITCVDIGTLTCTSTTLDMSLNLNLYWSRIGFELWRGKPSIFFVSKDKLNILVLEDYKTHKWADALVFPLPSPENYRIKCFFEPHISTDETEDIFYCGQLVGFKHHCRALYYVYKLKSKVVSLSPCLPRKVAATLISVRGMQPEKKKPMLQCFGAE